MAQRFPKVVRCLVAALAVFGCNAAQAQSRVGVTGAVNPTSQFDRSGALRTIVIGDNVLFKDRIITGDIGLVQVMFVDGSAFTVGPDARVVIDEFVYNPSTGSGDLVAEVTSGALRFVGGKLSKGNNPVRFRTPGGTLGVRGGIVNIDLRPSCLSDGRCPMQTASFVFGRDLVVTLPSGRRRVINKSGYTFVFFRNGSGVTVEILPTSLLNQSSLQASLAGRLGTNGGASQIPTAVQVVESRLPQQNSALRPLTVLPKPKPTIASSRYSPNPAAPGVDNSLNAISNDIGEQAQADFINNVVEDEIFPPLPPRPPFPVDGNIAGLSTPETFTAKDGTVVNAPGEVGIVTPFDLSNFGAGFEVDADGNKVALRVGEDLLPFPAELGESEIEPFESQTLGVLVRGTVFRGADDFALYYLQKATGDETGAEDVTYLLTGEPTSRDVILSNGESHNAMIRTYALSDDPQKRAKGIRSELRHLNPIIAKEFGNTLKNAAETPFIIVERSDGASIAHTLYAGLLIEGKGRNQRSAVNVDTGFVAADGDALQVVGRRRGSYRLSVSDPAAAMTGATGSLSAAEDGTVFGKNGENLVYTSGIEVRPQSETETDVFLDRQRNGGLLTEGELYSSTTQLATLESKVPAGEATRTTRTLNGFAAGMIEPDGTNSYAYRSENVGDFTVSFNAEQSNLGGAIVVDDAFDEDPVARSYRLAFGTDILGGESSSARSTFVDDDTYAGVATGPTNEPGSPQTTMTTNDNVIVNHASSTPDTYMVSASAVPQPQIFEQAGVKECACEFMEWGWWGTSTEFEGGGVPTKRNVAHLGTWVAGDVTPEEDLPTIGKGTYEGHAVGNVAAQNKDGSTAKYVATGQLNATYNFGARTGRVKISKFDGRTFSGTIAGGVGSDGKSNQFRGRLSGSGLRGSTDGAFARGPKGPAQGILGAFSVRGKGYRAVGTYLGEQR